MFINIFQTALVTLKYLFIMKYWILRMDQFIITVHIYLQQQLIHFCSTRGSHCSLSLYFFTTGMCVYLSTKKYRRKTKVKSRRSRTFNFFREFPRLWKLNLNPQAKKKIPKKKTCKPLEGSHWKSSKKILSWTKAILFENVFLFPGCSMT